MKDEETGADLSIDISEINFIKIVKDTKLLTGLGLGFLFGLGVTAVAFRGKGLEAVPSGLLVWSLLILVGGFWGIESGFDKMIKIEGGSDSDIKQALEELRAKARVKNFQ